MFTDYDNKISLVYRTRSQRNQQAAQLIQNLLGSNVNILNIGSGGEEFLKGALPDTEIFDVDIAGKADLLVDLETVDRFDFKDDQFNLVIALDLLEHIENFHDILKEMIRCSNQHVLISLPNPASSFISIVKNRRRNPDEATQRGYYEKFYGLPLEKPIDRPKWFFTVDDVRALFDHHVETGRISGVKYFSGHRWSIARLILRAVLGRRIYYNLFLPNIWILAKKTVK